MIAPVQPTIYTEERVKRVKRASAQAVAIPFRDFIQEAWPVLEPQTKFIPGWHIDCITQHLEAVTRGEIRHLIINVPPGTMKSLTVSVLWPAWVWTFRPDERFLTASYALSLAMRDSLKSRRLIQSQWYQAKYGKVFQLTGDQNQKMRYENDKSGFRLATSVGGATGERASVRILDDPHSINDISSDVQRESAIEWIDSVWSERAADATTSVDVIVMQRLHERDASGYLLAQALGYEHLMLPMRFESDRRCVTSIGFSDPRAEDGELLCPARFDEAAVLEKEKRLGSYGAAGQLQQRPAPRGGGMFKQHWFSVVDDVPVDARFVRYWDKAATESGHGTTSYTVGVLFAIDTERKPYIVDVVRGQWSAGQRDQIIKQTAESDRHRWGFDRMESIPIWVEQEPGSGGKESAENTIRQLMGYPVYADKVTGSKEVRANPLASYAEANGLQLLRGEWNHDLIDRFCIFPHGQYKDEIDAAAGGFNKLAAGGEAVTTASVNKALSGTAQQRKWRH